MSAAQLFPCQEDVDGLAKAVTKIYRDKELASFSNGRTEGSERKE